jgi:molecular chaperone DnaK
VSELRFGPSPVVRWSIVGEPAEHEGTLAAFRAEGSARIVTDVYADSGDEIRFVVHDASGAAAVSGLARVTALEDGALAVAITALGVDPTVAAVLAASVRAPAAPPSLPGVVGGPPPLRLDRPGTPAAGSRRAPTPDDDVMPQIEQLTVKKTGVVIGFDLGTTNTCAAWVDEGRVKIIPGRTGKSTIPSMITFEPDGSFHIGQRAADRQVLYPQRTVYGSKRLIGRTYRPELAQELQQHFAYPLAEAEGQRFGVRIDDRVISMETIAARVLDEVRSTAEEHLKRPVEAAVITVPAYFTEVQREAVRRAAKSARLAVHRIVNEPTAAAVAYGHKREDKNARIAVWDFGGGTFDFSIVDVREGELAVVATGGDNFVGGTDFDDFVASHLLAEFQRIEKIDFQPDAQQIARLREAAERAKCQLSEEEEAVIRLPELTREPKRNLQLVITREQFDGLTRSLVERTLNIAREVLGYANLTPQDIDDVVLVGGTTRIPAVQAAVQELFGRRPSKRINPDEAVAQGASLLADEIGSGTAPTLLDILPMSVGRGTAHRKFDPIVPRHTRLPVTRELTVDADVLGTVHLPLFQGDAGDVGQNEYLCSVIVEDRSLWDRGRVKLRLSFDEHCVMSVEAVNAKTGRALQVTLDRSRAVDDVLRDLGLVEGSVPEPQLKLPESGLGKALGRLFKLFGR